MNTLVLFNDKGCVGGAVFWIDLRDDLVPSSSAGREIIVVLLLVASSNGCGTVTVDCMCELVVPPSVILPPEPSFLSTLLLFSLDVAFNTPFPTFFSVTFGFDVWECDGFSTYAFETLDGVQDFCKKHEM